MTFPVQAANRGDLHAVADLFPIVYDEFRQLAAVQLADKHPGLTVDATSLIHESYLRLEGNNRFENRRDFFAAAVEAMRWVLVDHASGKLSAKRGGAAQRLPLIDQGAADPDERPVALYEAPTQFAADDSSAAEVVELFHFAGLTYDQVAAALDTTIYEVRNKWSYGRTWLKAALKDF